MLPGNEVRDVTTPPARTIPIESGTWFVGGITEKGRVTEPVLIRNLDQYVAEFGDYVSYGALYNALDVFFREGGSRAQVVRIVGPSAVIASAELPDGEEATLKIEAVSPGAWANTLKVKVKVSGGNFELTVLDGEEVLEESGVLADKTAAIAWAANSKYIRLEDTGEGGDPDEGTVTLESGADDRENISTTELKGGLDLMIKDLGPGQVSLPGYTSEASHEAILAHAKTNKRVALLDLTDSGTAATLEAATAALRNEEGAEYGAAFAPWAEVPGLTGGTYRTVPWSCIQAGIFARNDGAGYSINTAGAGPLGESRYAVDLTQSPWDDTTREDLNEASVNVVKKVIGNIQSYGNRTLADPDAEPQLALLSNARAHMKISAELDAVALRYVFANIDGKGKTFSRLNGELRAILGPYYSADVLYGATPEEAYYVDTEAVNTAETIQNKEINAAVDVRYSPAGERVRIDISRSLVTEVV